MPSLKSGLITVLEGEAVYRGTGSVTDGHMHLNILNDVSIVPDTEHQGMRGRIA